MTQGKRVELSAAQRTDVWERWERGQTGSFPYPENLQSLFAKPALPNNYQKTFRLSPIPNSQVSLVGPRHWSAC